MNVIGITVLKNTLNGKENAFKGNLPIYRNERSTSVAFHVLTNHIVVVEIKNHKLYKILTEHPKVRNSKNRESISSEMLFRFKQ